jgi:hypothetical protein
LQSSAIQIEQVLQAFFALGTKIDTIWSMYVMVNLGVLWFVFVTQRPFLFVERLMAFAGYTLLVLANANSLVDSYLMMQGMRLDIMNHMHAQFAHMPETFKSIVEIDYASRQQIIYLSHGVTWVVIVLFLGFRNRMITHYRRTFPEHASVPVVKE